MMKSIYVYRNMKTNKVEDLLVIPSAINYDEERTGFYYEGEITDIGGNYSIEKLLKELNPKNTLK